ncbi:SET domain zinc finger protein [Sarcoptes scabiei]|uniref:SET domain zinc finger protein n=1 Tax=Sarcoptes scabiei TaxID=52283 RepID=A0A132AK45_SARSC|nr:SET domain zinc finger protein [Sarcoptes scabiei]
MQSKFVQSIVSPNNNQTFLNLSQSPVEISSSNQSQSFLAQKFAAESTSDGDVDEINTLNRLSNQAFSSSISNFYHPFSPSVSSSSHFDTRHILGDGLLESSIDSLHVESSTNLNKNESNQSGQQSSTSQTTAIVSRPESIFNSENLESSIQSIIKHDNLSGISGVNAPNVTSSSSNRQVMQESPSHLHGEIPLPSTSLFDATSANNDIIVDSTTSISISNHHIQRHQLTPTNNANSSVLPSFSFADFSSSSPLNQTSISPNVINYGLSSQNFTTNSLLHINPSQSILSSLSSPPIHLDHYFVTNNDNDDHSNLNQHDQHSLELSKKDHIILDQCQTLPSTLQAYTNNRIITNNSTDDSNCLIADNSLSENLFHVLTHDDFVHETDLPSLHDNIINDLPVLTRAKASLPIDYLYLHEYNNNNGILLNQSLGVFAKKLIPKRTQFGPIEGVISLSDNHFSANDLAHGSKTNLMIFISDNFILNQIDENSSNWTRFVRPAANLNEQNLELIKKEFPPLNEVKFYFYTIKTIHPNEELKVWYSEELSQSFNINPLPGNNSDSSNLNSKLKETAQEFTIPSSQTFNIINTAGHKLRNKIAKSQLLNQNSSQQPIQESSIVYNKIESSTIDSNQLQNLLHNGNIQLITTDTLINDSMIQELEKSTKTPITVSVTTTTPIAKDFKPNQTATMIINSSNNSITNNEKPKYQCNICHKIFPRQYSLRRHQVMHSGEKQYKCPICDMAFNHVYNRNRHIKMHKNHSEIANRTIEEISDKKILENGKDLNSISINHTDNPTQETISSNEMVLNPKPSSTALPSLIVAKKSTEKIEVKQIQCQKLNGHINNEAKNGQIDSSSSNDSSVSSAIKDSSKIESELKSPTYSKSKESNNSSTNGLEKIFRCSQCYKRFSTQERLDKHGIVHDESAKKLSCDVCDRKFLTNSALSCHIKYHQFSADEPRKYDCALCDQVFDSIQLRREHVLVHINPETGLFHCPKCTKRFEDFSIIRKHLKSFHSNEIFPCTQCPKVFPRQDKLRLHMLCHIDRWEFKCNSCDKQFKRKDKLKEHTQRMHAPDRDKRMAAKMAARMQRVKVVRVKKTATKPTQPNYDEYMYKCHLCLFGFKRRGMLVNHLAKRHPEVPYNSVPELNMPIVKTSKDYYCQYCEKVYKSSSKRKAHIIKNHPGQSLPPSNRNKTSSSSSDISNQSFSATVGSITINPHFCDWCHKQYASKAKLMQHQRKKHPDKVINSPIKSSRNFTKSSSNDYVDDHNGILNNSSLNSNAAPVTNMFKFNTVINGDKATFTTIPITSIAVNTNSETTISTTTLPKSEIDGASKQINDVDSTKIPNYIDDENSSRTYLDNFVNGNPPNHYHSQHQKECDETEFLSNDSIVEPNQDIQIHEPQLHYAIDTNDPTFEDLMSINMTLSDVHHSNLGLSNSGSFSNNVITILGPNFTNDLSEISDIITHISDFQNGKTLLNSNDSTMGMNESSSNDLLLSGSIEENNWNQVCEEMAIV